MVHPYLQPCPDHFSGTVPEQYHPMRCRGYQHGSCNISSALYMCSGHPWISDQGPLQRRSLLCRYVRPHTRSVLLRRRCLQSYFSTDITSVLPMQCFDFFLMYLFAVTTKELGVKGSLVLGKVKVSWHRWLLACIIECLDDSLSLFEV